MKNNKHNKNKSKQANKNKNVTKTTSTKTTKALIIGPPTSARGGVVGSCRTGMLVRIRGTYHKDHPYPEHEQPEPDPGLLFVIISPRYTCTVVRVVWVWQF